jgi:hypothetical protein
MKPSYTTIDTIYRLAVSSYKERNNRQPFWKILNKIAEKDISSVKPKVDVEKRVTLFEDEDFFNIIGRILYNISAYAS